jgi:protein involved in polysaccharide export with SLBB domain
MLITPTIGTSPKEVDMKLALFACALSFAPIAAAQTPPLDAPAPPDVLAPAPLDAPPALHDAAAALADAAGKPALMLDGAIDPSTYIVGPGDRLVVELWGLRDVISEVEVNAEGRLVVPRVGMFPVAGMTLAALRRAVEARLKTTYPSLQGGVTLSRPRSFLVHVLGAVARPGAYLATPLTRVSDLLPRAGGALPNASLRRVEVRRASSVKLIADLIRATWLGDTGGDPRLVDGDTLFVPLASSTWR